MFTELKNSCHSWNSCSLRETWRFRLSQMSKAKLVWALPWRRKLDRRSNLKPEGCDWAREKRCSHQLFRAWATSTVGQTWNLKPGWRPLKLETISHLSSIIYYLLSIIWIRNSFDVVLSDGYSADGESSGFYLRARSQVKSCAFSINYRT